MKIKSTLVCEFLRRTGASAVMLLSLGAGALDVPPSTSPPGGLAPSNTPQIVLLTFDDAVTTGSYALVRQALTNFFNPNGHPIKATFFVSLDGRYDPASIRKLYDAGHEIGVHTMSHATSEASSLGRWQQEIAGAKHTLVRLCGIPAEDIVGFRAPFLKINDKAFRVLFKREFLYDSTFPEGLAGLSTAPGDMLWPYTLDEGLAQVAQPGFAPEDDYPGLFEIPLWLQFTNETSGVSMDPPESFSSNEVVRLWQTNFLARYQGNRAPYGLFLHATTATQWLSNPAHQAWRVGALRAFIAWALAQPDTWFITCRDLVDFMGAPVPASAAAAHGPFLTPARPAFPTAEISRCSYPGSHTFSVCGACPPFAPSYTNAYLGLVPMGGGAAALNIVSQDAQYAWCVMTVSNSTPSRIYEWSVNVALSGGTVQNLYDATWALSGGELSASARQYNSQIAPGASLQIDFSVLRSGGAVVFGEAAAEVWGVGQQPIRLDLRRLPDSDGWKLTWDDQALSYSVACTTNLLSSEDWTVVEEDVYLPVFTEPNAPGAGARFYRVTGSLEE